MGQALDSFILEGVTTTIPFLARVIRHPDFVAGKVDTRFLEREIAPPPARSMKLDVLFTPAGLTLAEVAGPDGLRDRHPAGHHLDVRGAAARRARRSSRWRATEEALRLAQTIGSDDVLLAGEQNCVRIDGFQLGNSPLEMTEAAVRGKTLIMTTTNGTQALLACQGAAAVYPACAANLSLAAEKAREALRARRARCSSSAPAGSGAFSLDDAYAAGRLVSAALGGPRGRRGLNDAALASLDLVRRYGDRWERPLRRSRAGRELDPARLRRRRRGLGAARRLSGASASFTSAG